MPTGKKSGAEKATPARKKKPKSAAKASKRGRPPRVRMYRHGLGDCFLLSFPRDGKRDFRVLIDCGVIQGTPVPESQKKEPAIISRVVEDLKKSTTDDGKPTIDVLVATHEHWDHLSGFAVATKEFDEFKIDRVWVAWTENPKDGVARRLRRERAEKVKALQLGLGHVRRELGAAGPLGAGQDATDEIDRIAGVLSFFGVDPVTGAGLGLTADGDPLFGAAGKPKLSVGEAMDWCRKHKNAEFWKPGQVIELEDEVPGLRVFVFGPPTDLVQLFKDMPTKKGRETYEEEHHLAAASQAFFGANVGQNDPHRAGRTFERAAPFDQKYRIGMREAAATEFFRTHYFGTGAGVAEQWRRIDGAGLAGAASFALKLDSDTNNTSLALAFELGDGRVLLFPGDAQVGNWESWHAGPDGKERTWAVKDSDGKEQTVTVEDPDGKERPLRAKDLLGRTVLYKVGHHGSHNATLRDKGLEMMTHPDLVAMVPVDVYVAHEKKHWTRMPFEPLMDALHRRTSGRVIIADRSRADPNPKLFLPGKLVGSDDAITVEGKGKQEVKRPLWVEYSLPES